MDTMCTRKFNVAMASRFAFGLAALLLSHPSVAQQTDSAAAAVVLGDSGLSMTAPSSWQSEEPRSQMVQTEFAIASGLDDVPDVRIIVMQAGGGVEPNMARWIGQFKPPAATDAKQPWTRDKRKLAEQTVHTLDIRGTYSDRPGGPRSPAVEREDYRMLAAIVATETGDFFIKMYGHQDLIDKADSSFEEFLNSLKKRAN